MLHVMMVMLAVMGLSGAAFATSNGDAKDQNFDRASKQAYAAAEAGLADYSAKLNSDNNYWTQCGNEQTSSVPSYIRSRWNGSGNDPRQYKTYGTARNTSSYTIELLPANGSPACSKADSFNTLIDSKTNTFRVRVTGRAKQANGASLATRSLVGTYKRKSFLEFLDVQDIQEVDPIVRNGLTIGRPTSPDFTTWAAQNCARYRRNGRGTTSYSGQVYWDNAWRPFPKSGTLGCSNVYYAGGAAGPMHTNDNFNICGANSFGRPGRNDRIETSDPTPFRYECPGATPTVNTASGKVDSGSPIMQLPPTNAQLKSEAGSAYTFFGKTIFQFNPSNITVQQGNTTRTISYPPNGVLYVDSSACGVNYEPWQPLNDPQGCGDAFVAGQYGKDVTVAAAKDVLIYDDLVHAPGTDTVLGLIPNGFNRFYHFTSGYNTNISYAQGGEATCTNTADAAKTRKVEAAMLSLQHSWIYDGWFCGDVAGRWDVKGANASKFSAINSVNRGGPGNSGTSMTFTYDDRLQVHEPPHFMNPVQAAWRLRRQTEVTGR